MMRAGGWSFTARYGYYRIGFSAIYYCFGTSGLAICYGERSIFTRKALAVKRILYLITSSCLFAICVALIHRFKRHWSDRGRSVLLKEGSSMNESLARLTVLLRTCSNLSIGYISHALQCV
jgi:hypothetical protein